MNGGPILPWPGSRHEYAEREVSMGLSGILASTIVFLRKYVVVTSEQAVAIALWAAHTHAIDAFDCTPYLQIGSATKRSGKTRLLEVLEPLVAKPWFTGRTSAAALVRKVDAERPTLLLDESDAAFGGEKEYAEALRGQLNTGYRKSGKATVCVGQGSKIEARDFSTFCPKAIAGIGTLPDTVSDRSIPIILRRRMSDEPCERWRERDGHAEAMPLRDLLGEWSAKALEHLRDARPDLPSNLGDRQADVWEPLIAIADLAGDDWPARARAAAAALSGSLDDSDITIELLRDVAEIVTKIPPHQDVIASTALIEKLVADEDRPWATWRKGEKPITPRGLARLLDPLDVHVDQYKVAGERIRGYRIDAFADAIARYLPSQASMRYRTNKTGPNSQNQSGTDEGSGTASEIAKTPIDTGAGPHAHIETGKSGISGDGRDRGGV
jgi:hypothetical protein